MQKILSLFRYAFNFIARKNHLTLVVSNEEIKKKVPRKSVDKGNMGSMYYLGDLLDNLADYFIYLKKFKKNDPEGYALYSRIGGQIINGDTLVSVGAPISPRWKTERPSFGMIHTGSYITKDLNAKLMYFKKVKNLPHVQRANGDVYEVCLLYTDDETSKTVFVGTFYIEIDSEAKIRLLKNKKEKVISIRGKTGRQKGKLFSITQQSWEPAWLLTEIMERGTGGYKNEEEVAVGLFTIIANMLDNANSGFEVRASKNGLMGTFCIDMLRTPYFFKDRQKSITVNGKTKKIFHIVRGHKRILKNGDTQNVKTHFRGERKFNWHGYDINISMQGYHHRELRALQAAALTEQEALGGYDIIQVGEIIKQHMAQ